MNTADPATKFNALIADLRKRFPEAVTIEAARCCEPFIDPAEPILAEFIRSFMIWESTVSLSASALKNLAAGLVDFNEMRICLPNELIDLFGSDYPLAHDRAIRLRSALTDIYARHHAVTLEPLATLGKREARDFLESISGTPRFVVARVLLLTQSGHLAPIDSRINRQLINNNFTPKDAQPEETAGLLEKRVRSGEMLETYALLQAWADEIPLNTQQPPILQGQSVKSKPAGVKPASKTKAQDRSAAATLKPSKQTPPRKPKRS